MAEASRPRIPVLVRALGVVLALLGVTLASGGVYLLGLGGSPYYLLAGLGLVAAGVFIWRGSAIGAWIYLAVVVGTLAWALWESGFDGWALVPRLGGPLVLAALVLIALPWLVGRGARRSIAYGGGAVLAGIVAVVGIGVVTTGPARLQAEVPAAGLGGLRDPSAMTVGSDWPYYGGTQSAQRFSPLAQINAQNVGKLQRAWQFRTGDVPEKKYGAETTPLKVGARLYLCTARNKMMALDARTGRKLWSYDPKVSDDSIPYTAACRGVTYYRAPRLATDQLCAERIIEGTLDGRLIAVDAATGRPCPGFGREGVVDYKVGMGKVEPGMVSTTSPVIVVRDTIITNHQVLDGETIDAPSGVIQGFDAVTGEFRWAWDMMAPGRTGRPAQDETFSRGTPNSWTIATADETLGLVYVPMGNSAGDYMSFDRAPAENFYGTSLVALDAVTGRPRWRFQTVHGDVWDYDLGSQATLVDLPAGGGITPALVLPSKQGDIYVLDRRTGRPLTAVTERAAPTGGVNPQLRSPTQPFSSFHTLARPRLEERHSWGISPIDQMICRIQFRRASYDGMYTPPTADRPFLQYPGYNGGSDWGGVSIDPRRGVIIANYNDVPNYNRLVPREVANQKGIYPLGDPRRKEQVSRGGPVGEGGIDPQAGMPYAIKVNAGWLLPFTQVSCKQPPLGGIRAIDIKTGQTLWDRPLGTARANGPFGIPSHLPFDIGTPNNGGPLVTGGGLLFIAAATDNMIRAIDIETGKTVWQDVLPAGGQATPISYSVGGRQYVAIMAAGHHFMRTPKGDHLIAYALPER